jgi:hypothetical protein
MLLIVNFLITNTKNNGNEVWEKDPKEDGQSNA